MSNNFDWRTEEEEEWDGGRPDTENKNGRRRWLLPLMIVAVLLVVSGVIYWQVQERAEAAEAAISDDILTSFRLIRRAEDEGDIELFRNLLSGSDLEWAVAQQDLFAKERLFDLTPYGLVGEPESLQEVEVSLAPQLNSAEVTALATYRPSGDADSDSIQLLQTAVFRKGERWVWSPPRDQFWQGQASIAEGYLTVRYPKRDEDLAVRLAGDLDHLIASVCGEVAQIDCPNDLGLDLILSYEPDVMVEIGERFAAEGIFGSRLRRQSAGGDLQMSLPTPSLLGTPVDEAGYEALRDGYGTQLIAALVDRFVDPVCCETESRLRAATRKTLSDYGLNAWSGIDVNAYEEPAVLPGSDRIALLCSNGFERQQRLFLLDPSTMAWRQENTSAELISIKSSPAGDGVLLLGVFDEEDTPRSQVWRNSSDGSTLLFDLPVNPDEAEQLSWELQERQRLLVVEVPDTIRGYSRYFTIDLEECDQNGCLSPPMSTVNRPVWSPDGSELLIRAYGLLWWRVGTSMVPIADGSAPFWIDEDTYGYARSFGRDQALVLVEAGDEESERVVLTTNDLRDVLDPAARSTRIIIGRVSVGQPPRNQESDSTWLILAFEIGLDGAVNEAHFFTFVPESGKVSLLPHVGRLLSFNVTPSGEKMAVAGFVDAESRWEIGIYDFKSAGTETVALAPGGSAEEVPSYAWSPDETWLLVLEQGLLTLIHPETGTSRLVKPPEASCLQATWYGMQNNP